MNSVQLFGVVVRSIGLLMAIYGSLSSCIGLLLIVWGGWMMLLFGFPAMCLGLWLLRGPKPVIAFAYPQDHGEAA